MTISKMEIATLKWSNLTTLNMANLPYFEIKNICITFVMLGTDSTAMCYLRGEFGDVLSPLLQDQHGVPPLSEYLGILGGGEK